jgi:hypothetical protein
MDFQCLYKHNFPEDIIDIIRSETYDAYYKSLHNSYEKRLKMIENKLNFQVLNCHHEGKDICENNGYLSINFYTRLINKDNGKILYMNQNAQLKLDNYEKMYSCERMFKMYYQILLDHFLGKGDGLDNLLQVIENNNEDEIFAYMRDFLESDVDDFLKLTMMCTKDYTYFTKNKDSYILNRISRCLNNLILEDIKNLFNEDHTNNNKCKLHYDENYLEDIQSLFT